MDQRWGQGGEQEERSLPLPFPAASAVTWQPATPTWQGLCESYARHHNLGNYPHFFACKAQHQAVLLNTVWRGWSWLCCPAAASVLL